MKILIKNATVVNADKEFCADILINNSRIAKIAKNIKEKVDREIDTPNGRRYSISYKPILE